MGGRDLSTFLQSPCAQSWCGSSSSSSLLLVLVIIAWSGRRGQHHRPPSLSSVTFFSPRPLSPSLDGELRAEFQRVGGLGGGGGDAAVAEGREGRDGGSSGAWLATLLLADAPTGLLSGNKGVDIRWGGRKEKLSE